MLLFFAPLLPASRTDFLGADLGLSCQTPEINTDFYELILKILAVNRVNYIYNRLIFNFLINIKGFFQENTNIFYSKTKSILCVWE